MRKKLDRKIQYSKTTSFILFGCLIIDYVVFHFVRAGLIEFIGAVLAFAWIMFTVMSLTTLTEEKNNIDEFYLEYEYEKHRVGK